MASNFTQFVLVDNGGTGDVTVAPSNFANGVAEWISSNSRSQAYKVTCSVRQSSAQNRKYTIKVEVPKVATQTVGGVELPVAAWRSYLNMELTIPIFATNSDCELIVKAMQGLLKRWKPDSLSNRSKLRHLLIDAGHSNMRITHVEDNKEVQLFMY